MASRSRSRKRKRGGNGVVKYRRGRGGARAAMPSTMLPQFSISPELKWHDFALGFNSGATWVPVSTNVNGQLLNGIARGNTPSTRVGNSILMKSLLLRVTVVPGVNDDMTAIRLLVVYDTQTNGAISDCSDVLTDMADIEGGGASTNYYHGNMALERRQRYKVLYDKTRSIGVRQLDTVNGTGYAHGPSSITWKLYRKLNLPVIYNDDGATSTEISQGAIMAFLIADDRSGSATVDPTAMFSARVRYDDQ